MPRASIVWRIGANVLRRMTNGALKNWMPGVSVVATSVLLCACAVKDLSNSCLPLKAPGNVVLLRDVHSMPWTKTDLLLDPANPSRVDPAVPRGTVLRVEKISQPRAVDSHNADIEVFGELEDGRTFLYRWGYGRNLYRAPWEPAGTAALRAVPCANN